MESAEIKRHNAPGNKISTILIILSILLSVVLIFKFSHSANANDELPIRTRNRHPTLQRRNAMKPEEIEKILKKIGNVSDNLKKNLK
jgi:hypothetical protein